MSHKVTTKQNEEAIQMIYQTINQSDFHDAFRKMDRLNNFSYEGRIALFNYLNDLEEYELDVVGLCCEFSENKIEETLKDYNLDSLEDLMDETQVIWNDGTNVLFAQY